MATSTSSDVDQERRRTVDTRGWRRTDRCRVGRLEAWLNMNGPTKRKTRPAGKKAQ
jgi:hypothetical protein